MKKKAFVTMDNLKGFFDGFNVPLKQAYEYGYSIGLNKNDVQVVRKLFGFVDDKTTKNWKTDKERDEWVELYREGETINNIAKKYGVCDSSVRNLLNRRGVYSNERNWTTRQLKALEFYIGKGMTARQISPLIGRSRCSIHKMTGKLKLFKKVKK